METGGDKNRRHIGRMERTTTEPQREKMTVNKTRTKQGQLRGHGREKEEFNDVITLEKTIKYIYILVPSQPP